MVYLTAELFETEWEAWKKIYKSLKRSGLYVRDIFAKVIDMGLTEMESMRADDVIDALFKRAVAKEGRTTIYPQIIIYDKRLYNIGERMEKLRKLTDVKTYPLVKFAFVLGIKKLTEVSYEKANG